MADIRKDQERDELHRAIQAADGLRGSVDVSLVLQQLQQMNYMT